MAVIDLERITLTEDLNANRLDFDGQSSGDTALSINDGGNVEIPNGNLSLTGTNPEISSVRKLIADGDLNVWTGGGGSNAIQVYDQSNTQYIARFNEGGNVEIPNGFLDVGENNLKSVGTTYYKNDQRILPLSSESRFQYDDGTDWIDLLNLKDNGNVGIPNGQTLLQDGSASSPALSFSNDTDTGWYLGSTGNPILSVSNGDVISVGSSAIDFRGSNLRQVGGTTDANSGAIRLANGANINSRNNGDSADLSLITTNGIDDVIVGGSGGDVSRVLLQSGGNTGIEFDGHTIGRVGGTTDANSGAIRLANNKSIKARKSDDSEDLGLVKIDGNNRAAIGFDGIETVTISGSRLIRVGGSPDAGSGAIRLANDTSILARDSGNNGDFGITFGSSDAVEIDSADLRLATGQVIEDGGGTTRLEVGSSGTRIIDELGRNSFVAAGNNQTQINAYSDQEINFQDNEGGFRAIQYFTDASLGRLELTNANIGHSDGYGSIRANIQSVWKIVARVGSDQNAVGVARFEGVKTGSGAQGELVLQSTFKNNDDSNPIRFESNNFSDVTLRSESGELVGIDSSGNSSTLT